MESIYLSSGTEVTPEDITKIASAVNDLLRTTSKDPGQYPLADSTQGISLLPAFRQSGANWELVRVALNLLKGPAGKQIQVQVTEIAIQWRYEEGEWLNLVMVADLMKPAVDAGKESVRMATEASQAANTATDKANTAALEAGNQAGSAKTQAAEALLQSTEAKKQAEEARKQALFAKEQGDNAAALASIVEDLGGSKLDGLAVENDLLYGVINGELVGEGISLPAGGGGGGGGGAAGSILRVKSLSGSQVTVAVGQPVVISYNWSSLDSLDNTPTGDGTVDYFVNNIKVVNESVAQGDISWNATAYMKKGLNAVRIALTDSYGVSRSLSVKAEVVEVGVSSSFDASKPVTGEFPFRFTPVGALEKTVHFLIDNMEVATLVTSLTNRELSQVLPAQTHGAHLLKVYATATVNEVAIVSEPIYFDLICVTEGNETPIVASAWQQGTVRQYDTLVIPFYVYTPSTSLSVVTLWVNNVKVGERSADRGLQEWTYLVPSEGGLSLSIRSGKARKDFTFEVQGSAVDVEPVTQDLELYLTSRNRSNSDTNREEWKFGTIAAQFHGLNWKTNGWVKDDDGYSCLRLTPGSTALIPLNLFGADLRTAGKTVELEFRVKDVYNYDSPVIQCWNGDRGIRVTPQEASLRSEQSGVSTLFKDQEHVRLSFVIQKRSSNRLMNIYVNGINSRSFQYPETDNFTQAQPVGITIGGSEATIDIYNIRSYTNDLTRYQLLDNYIFDLDNATLKQQVYVRNQIYDSYGAIDLNLLNDYIPVMTIIGDLPQYKGDKKTVSVVFSDVKRPERSFIATGVQIDVQGTSSQYYPRKNYKLKFSSGFEMTVDGSHADGFTLSSGDCLPAKVFCTKADFAESSGTHNTGIANYADWLLKRMDILTAPQQANPVIRTTVYGEPCCIAHRATEQAPSEFIGKYNFNTDKAAEDTFGFADGDESWEFLNNTSDLALFKISDFSAWQDTLEARYPDGSEETAKVKRIFDWVVSCGTDAAKFRSEIGSYMEKDHIIFYWLFTFILGMVDQRAKNMFLTVYGDRLWLFILYDNDTCLGINNEGEISFMYDIEVHDVVGAKAVWNGADSALWNLVENAFPDEIREMYYKMRQQGFLTFDRLTEFMDTRQSDKWSEAIYNEDGFFKYEKPLVDGYMDYSQGSPQLVKTGAFLYALQGSRELYRKWWLSNRLNYLDSKFLAGAILADTAVFRTFTPASWVGVRPNADITLSTFSALYLNVKWGSVAKSHRVGANDTYTMRAPEGMQFNDTETIIYGASLITSLGDLSPLYVGSVDVSRMTKLKELIVGSPTEGYKNRNLRTLSIGQNKLLQKLDIRNCTDYSEPLGLGACVNITEVYAEGSAITAVNLPDGGNLSLLHLPETITNLTIKNQPALRDARFSIAGVTKLSTIVFENSGINIFAVIDRCFGLLNPVLGKARLIGINASANNLDSLYKLTKIGGVDERGDDLPQAVVTGTFHAFHAVEDKLAKCRAAFPELTITYTNLLPPTITTFVFKSSQSKPLTNVSLECDHEFTKVNDYTYKVSADDDTYINLTFSADNHTPRTERYLVSGTRTQEYPVTYVPLRTIRVKVYGQSVYLQNAVITIGEDSYISDANGYVYIRNGAAISGTVSATGYGGDTFSFSAITNDSSHTVEVYGVVEVMFVVKDNFDCLIEGAIVSCDEKEKETNKYGEVIFQLAKGIYSYTATRPNYQEYSGSITVETFAFKREVMILRDLTLIRPYENGNIQMLLAGASVSVYVTSTSGSYTIIWGDGTSSSSTGSGKRTYQHVYNDTEFYQVEIVGVSNITYAMSDTESMVAYWSIGNSKIRDITFNGCSKLNFFGDVFKNDATRTSINSLFQGCAIYSIDLSPLAVLVNVSDASNLFRNAKLRSVDLSPLTTLVNVKKAASLFQACFNLTSIDLTPLSSWVNVTDASYLLNYCARMPSIDLTPLSSWVNVTDASAMLGSLSELSSVDLTPLSSWVNVIKASRLFYATSPLRFVDLTPLAKWTKMTENGEMFILVSNLSFISILATPPFPLTSGAFKTYNDCPIYVPDDAVDTFKTATNWSAYADRIKPISEKPAA